MTEVRRTICVMNDNTKTLLKGGGLITAMVLAATGVIVGGQAIASALPAPEPTHTVAVSVYEINGFAATGPTKAPPPAAVVEVVTPAPVVEAPAEPTWGNYPAGYAVPFVPSTDPQNANGGEWAVDACASGSASTGGDGQPYCD